MSEDPIGLEGGINLYQFAAGDPVNLSDPSGLRVEFYNSEAMRVWYELWDEVYNATYAGSYEIARSARALLKIMSDLESHEDLLTISVENRGVNGFGRRDRGWGIIVDANYPSNASIYTRLVHELGHANAYMLERKYGKLFNVFHSVDIENYYRQINACRSRTVGVDFFWIPSC